MSNCPSGIFCPDSGEVHRAEMAFREANKQLNAALQNESACRPEITSETQSGQKKDQKDVSSETPAGNTEETGDHPHVHLLCDKSLSFISDLGSFVLKVVIQMKTMLYMKKTGHRTARRANRKYNSKFPQRASKPLSTWRQCGFSCRTTHYRSRH